MNLPETEIEIEEEIKKQESLLADLHLQISSGAASKKTEEQIWEQQRIVTQLKRKLRTAVKKESDGGENNKKYEPIDYDEELDFSLRVPSRNEDAISQVSHEATVVVGDANCKQTAVKSEDKPDAGQAEQHKVTVLIQQRSQEEIPAPSQQQPQPQPPQPSHVTVIKGTWPMPCMDP